MLVLLRSYYLINCEGVNIVLYLGWSRKVQKCRSNASKLFQLKVGFIVKCKTIFIDPSRHASCSPPFQKVPIVVIAFHYLGPLGIMILISSQVCLDPSIIPFFIILISWPHTWFYVNNLLSCILQRKTSHTTCFNLWMALNQFLGPRLLEMLWWIHVEACQPTAESQQPLTSTTHRRRPLDKQCRTGMVEMIRMCRPGWGN